MIDNDALGLLEQRTQAVNCCFHRQQLQGLAPQHGIQHASVIICQPSLQRTLYEGSVCRCQVLCIVQLVQLLERLNTTSTCRVAQTEFCISLLCVT